MAEVDLRIPTGVTWRRCVTWADAAGDRISLAGMRARMEIRKRPGGVVYLTSSSENGTIALEADEVAGSAVGVVTLTIPGPLSALISVVTAEYDVKLMSATVDGEPSYRLLEGKVTFDLAVTR